MWSAWKVYTNGRTQWCVGQEGRQEEYYSSRRKAVERANHLNGDDGKLDPQRNGCFVVADYPEF